MIIYDANGTPIIDIEVDDSSYRYRGLMRSDELSLFFSLAEHVELPVGAYCTFEDTTYHLMSLSNVTVHHRRNYEYHVTMYSPSEQTKNYVIYNVVDKRLRFEQSGTPGEHLQQIVDNLNAREGSGWSIGTCIDGEPQILAYNYTTCWDGIVQLADAFNTEFEIVNKTISLKKVEYHTSNPLSLAYGKGNGLRPGVQRIEASMGIGRVFIQGGDRNIGLDNYDAKTLHLPKGVTIRFDGTDFVNAGGVQMSTSDDGLSVFLTGSASNVTEASLDLSYIYPSRVGTVSTVVYEYKKNFYSYSELIAAFPNLTEEDWYEVYVHFCDSSIPSTLDYDACLMGNDEPLTVIFQNGELIGREFNVTFNKEAKTKEEGGQTATVIPADRFEIEHATIDGVDMPNSVFRPAVGDKYAIFNCALPQEYINAGEQSKQGAEWDALKEAAKFLYENMEPKVAYRGDLDPLFSKGDWINIGDYLKCGSYISFSDPAVQTTPIRVRIVGVRQYVNNKECPTIEFSNDIVAPTISSTIKSLATESAHVEELNKQTQRYAQRSFKNAKETMGMLIDAKLKGYTEAISPIAVQTMQMLVGDESLQFKFWQNAACTVPINPVQPFDMATKTVTISHAYLQHMTLGIDSIMPAEGRQLSDYKIWEMQEHTSAVMSDPDARYYVYAKCKKNDTSALGQYVFSETAIEMEEVSGYYHFLIGILNSEMDGDRDFASLYGFTEILPGQITTDKIRSSNGYSWFDMNLNQMRFGNANKSFSWNLNNNSEFLVEGGTITVKSSGSNNTSIITCDRGQYSDSATYYYGDEVYTADGASYIYINHTASSGHTPPNATYWQLKKAAGSSAQLISIKASSLIFSYESETSQSPSGDSTITLTAETQNIASTTFVWSLNKGSGWSEVTGHTSATLVISPSDFTTNTLKVKVHIYGDSSLYDEVSLFKVYGGTDSISAFLTNTTHLFAGSQTAAVQGSDTFETVVYRGKDRLSYGSSLANGDYTIGTITGQITGKITASVVTDSSSVNYGKITVAVTTSLTQASGTLTIPLKIKGYGTSTETIDGTTYTYGTVELAYSWAISFTGEKGSAGAKLRGPTKWSSDREYESGVTTEFQDIVVDTVTTSSGEENRFYICVSDVGPTSTHPENDLYNGTTGHWKKASQFDFVATDVLYAKGAKIDNAYIKKLLTEMTINGNILNPISISEDLITIKDSNPSSDSYGKDKVTITSASIPTSAATSSSYTMSRLNKSISTTSEDPQVTGSIVQSLSQNGVTITQGNNLVTIPAIDIYFAYPATTAGSARATYSILIGETIICSGSVSSATAGGSASVNHDTYPAREITLPIGNNQPINLYLDYDVSGASPMTCYFRIAISGSYSGQVTSNITYPAIYTTIASNGAQFRYGNDGIRLTQSGAYVIQGGSEFNIAGLGLYGFPEGTALPKRIVFCKDSYPGTEETGVFYIKVSVSSS